MDSTVLMGLLQQRKGISTHVPPSRQRRLPHRRRTMCGAGHHLRRPPSIWRSLAQVDWVCFTKRHLLEWMTAAQAKAKRRLNLAAFYRQMARGVVDRDVDRCALAVAKPSAVSIALAVLLLLWILSPVVARWVSQPASYRRPVQLSDDDVETLRLIAHGTCGSSSKRSSPRKTTGCHPTTIQDDPGPVVEREASPANIGMYLLATVRSLTTSVRSAPSKCSTASRKPCGRSASSELFRGRLYN